MKDFYTYNEGKIIVHDTKSGIKEYDYQDNIEEILLKENEIEEILDKIEIYSNENQKNQEILKINEEPFPGFWEKIILSIIISVFLTTVISLMSLMAIPTLSITYIALVASAMLGASSLFIFGINNSCKKYIEKYKNIIKNTNSEIEKLNVLLNEKQKELNIIKSNSKKDNEKYYINDENTNSLKNKITYFKNVIDFYRNCGPDNKENINDNEKIKTLKRTK